MAGKRRAGKWVTTTTQRRRGAHRRKPRREPYQWLGVGAVTLGLGFAVVSGTGVAYADGTDSA